MSKRQKHADTEAHPHAHEPHPHECGTLFGCGDEKGTGVVREDIKDSLARPRQLDRLTHMDGVNQRGLASFLDTRGRNRRELLKASGFFGALAAIGPWFARQARADEPEAPAFDPGNSFGTSHDADDDREGRTHVVPSTDETVRLGVYDTTLPDIVDIDSGDTVIYPDTWSHFLNEMQPGVSIDTLAQLRVSHPGRGPHSIIGPVGVNGAEPGDLLEIRYQRLHTYDWGAVFHNPGALGTGLLPDLFPQGQVKYLDVNADALTAEFAPRVTIPLNPFQGTLGLAPPDGYFPPLSPGVTSSVPPGPHAGNLDLRELGEGSRLFIPVWQAGARLYTGDSHAVQGDGEISLTALETRMREVRIKVVLHKAKSFTWPFAETSTHWIAIGLNRDLNLAMRLAAINAINFLRDRAGMTEADAYALCSIACSFRVTQVVDIVKGVHCMIPKTLFREDYRRTITVV